MITQEIDYAKLERQWLTVGRGVYQKRSRIEGRLPFCMKFFDRFNGKDVAELGCNAGVYGYEIAKHAKSYVGVDQGEYYIAQANITKRYIENENVSFLCGNIKDYIKKVKDSGEMPNALFSSFALYHFSTKEVDRIAESLLPSCSDVVISTRTQKRSPMRLYNKYKFWKPKNVAKWLQRAGFTTEIHNSPDKKFAVITGKKGESNGTLTDTE